DVSSLNSLSCSLFLPCIIPLSLHDALPIYLLPLHIFSLLAGRSRAALLDQRGRDGDFHAGWLDPHHEHAGRAVSTIAAAVSQRRSEEHTSELQSRFDLVCCLLLDKKK